MSKKVLCMGSLNMDLTMFMDRMPKSGETVKTDNFATYPGGKGGNQAVAAARLGGEVSFFGKLGDDEFSKELLEGLRSEGVDVSCILIELGATAGVAMIRIDSEGMNSISFTPGANAMLTPKDVEEHGVVFEEHDYLMLSAELPMETVYAAVRMAKKKGLIVLFDPSPIPKQPIPQDMIPLFDYIKPNEIEAGDMVGVDVTDENSAKEALKKLEEMGYPSPIITMGKKGCMLFLDGIPTLVSPPEVQAVDSTAAGDVFLGAMAAALCRGELKSEAVEFALCASALSTTSKGAQTSIPTWDMVRQFKRTKGTL